MRCSMEPEKYVTCIICHQIFIDSATCPGELDGQQGAVCGSCALFIANRSKKAIEDITDAAEEEVANASKHQA